MWRGSWRYDARPVYKKIWNDPNQSVRARAAKASLKYPDIVDIKFTGSPDWDGVHPELYGE